MSLSGACGLASKEGRFCGDFVGLWLLMDCFLPSSAGNSVAYLGLFSSLTTVEL